MGPVWWLAPLMFPIEIISHFARILSLTVRLFANMLASDMITIIFFSMFPVVLPIAGLGLHLFVALIQAYIFMLLTMIYLGLATEHAESH
jgi:F-type H+-transporting ATPase subunit a